jgi:geranylgeranyl diphosphate synthase type II
MQSASTLYNLYEEKFSTGNFNNSPHGLYAPVNHIMGIKGKRIRPLLLLMAADMFGADVQQALNPSFAMEVFHNFTLVHDDIMDNADIRRGIPTVHKVFGINAGILAGDVMLAYAYKYLTDVPASYIPSIMNVFTKTAIEIFEGQQMDVDFEKRIDVTLDEYLKMIEYKTSVLLACSLQIGAILGNADEQNQQDLYHFGLNLGLSFQIKDDLLDAFGEGDKVGKRIGGDILMNKKTYLFISTQSMAGPEQKKELDGLMNEANADKKIEGVKQLMMQTGAYDATLQKAEALYKESLALLEKVNVAAERKKNLFEMAEKVNARDY